MKDHKCWASSHQVDIRAAKSQMYEMVAKEPTRSLLEICTAEPKLKASFPPRISQFPRSENSFTGTEKKIHSSRSQNYERDQH